MASLLTLIQYFLSTGLFILLASANNGDTGEGEGIENNQRFKIEGKVEVTSSREKNWISNTQVLVDGGEYVGFLRSDGSFVVNGLPSGTFVVEITNPTYVFEAARIDITSKGKMRARKVNYLQPSVVKGISYPLEMRERTKATYFQLREQWRITDFLFNPMVLTMLLPLLLIMVLPKMMNAADNDTQKEMQTQMKALNDKSSMPDISEFFTNLFGSPEPKKAVKAKTTKRNTRP